MTGDRGRVLAVCTGNICRSPFVERILHSALAEHGIRVTSAGTRAVVGSAMSPGSAVRLADRGVDGSGFRARQFAPDVCVDVDLVLTATREHRAQVVSKVPSLLRRTFAVTDFADLVAGWEPPAGASVAEIVLEAARRRSEVPPRADADILDPIGLGDEAYDTMARQLDEVLPAVVAALRIRPAG